MKTLDQIKMDLKKICHRMSVVCREHGCYDCENYRYVFLIGARKQGLISGMKYLYIKKFLRILKRYTNDH